MWRVDAGCARLPTLRAQIHSRTRMRPSGPLHSSGVPPFAGRHAIGLAEPPAEVRGVGEAPVSGYRGDGLSASARARQLVTGRLEPAFEDLLAEGEGLGFPELVHLPDRDEHRPRQPFGA